MSFKQTSLNISTAKRHVDKQWQKLTSNERKIWNLFSPNAKSTIIGAEDLKRIAVVTTTPQYVPSIYIR